MKEHKRVSCCAPSTASRREANARYIDVKRAVLICARGVRTCAREGRSECREKTARAHVGVHTRHRMECDALSTHRDRAYFGIRPATRCSLDRAVKSFHTGERIQKSACRTRRASNMKPSRRRHRSVVRRHCRQAENDRE